ncbi:MAG TPA: nitrite reductase large subunit NirB [Polyangiaceae bacterium]|nr:nitrite reductase large subunit NirB [Polyangiaceae bacterium]
MSDKLATTTPHVALAETPNATALAECLRGLGVRLTSFGRNSQHAGAIPLESWIVQLIEGEFDDVVFTSAQGVHLLVEMAHQLEKRDAFLDALSVARKIARGPKTARALSELGLTADVIAKNPEPEALIRVVAGLGLENRVVGVQPFERATELALAQAIEDDGGTARVVAPTATVDPEALEFLTELQSGNLQGIVFLTERTAAWLFDACRVSGLEDRLIGILRKLPVLASEAASSFLRRRGVHPDLVLSHATVMQPVQTDLAMTLGLIDDPAPLSVPKAVGKHRVVVIGNGMVSQKLCDRLTEKEEGTPVRITVLGEETWPAYDRVHLSEYFSGKSAEDLVLAPVSWYGERGIDLRLGQRAARIDRESRLVITNSGTAVPYDSLVLATGAAPFVPPVPGLDKSGVFVYRTIEDLEAITAYAKNVKTAAVIGGGLLGLEAAKAARDLGLVTHVVEQAPRLMPRQLDDAGSKLLQRQIESLGLHVHVGVRTTGVLGQTSVTGLRFGDGERLDVEMIIVSAGIRPRDQLAAQSGINVFTRGGIVVNDTLQTSDPNVYAVGECAIHEGTLYGLVAPGYEMATALAKTLRGAEGSFRGADMSTKLKLLGVDVASLGDPFADEADGTATVVFQDLLAGVYKKLIVSADGKKLLGAILVGDTAEYGTLLPFAKSGDPLPVSPDDLLFGSRSGSSVQIELSDAAQVCSCNNVTKLDIVQAIAANDGCSLDTVKKCTKAGTGCGGCMPLVTDVYNLELLKAGKTVSRSLCEHFDYSRQELYDLVKVRGYTTFAEVVAAHGRGHGCEICKPALAAILASTRAEPITRHATIQDTNDRFLANIQRGGLYSVVPRIPAGEITPEKLLVIGEVAKKYSLYTKITGGQRIDLFGARVDQLPDIWEDLVNAGFESGHAYGKSIRTVKSCVGSTWCRYGVQDSVGFAVRVEERYKGLRSPHKLKSAVSGCVRECAEAQSKDFGLIATEKGWNLYVCGNGGAKPRHADLLAADIDEATAIRYIDRFLMYYIKTADRLTRTSVWLDKLEGGIDHLKKVVIDDSLGLAAEFEADMQKLVDAFVCEWTDVVRNPEKRALFKHFATEGANEQEVPMVDVRGQQHPGPWPTASLGKRRHLPVLSRTWVRVAQVDEVPADGGMAFRHGGAELALFRFESRGQWYATQNLCPHKRELILSRGLVGDQGGAPKVACPFHKKTFHLETGECLSGDDLSIHTFPAKVDNGWVFVELPPAAELESTLAAPHSCDNHDCDAAVAAE